MQMTPAKIMLRFVLAYLAAVICPAFSAAVGTVVKVTPVQKVLELMTDLKAKAEGTMAEEAETFRKYNMWAMAQKKELEYEISTGKSQLESSSSTIGEATNDIKQLNKACAELETKIGGWEAEKSEAEKTREEEYAKFLSEEKSYMASIDAVKRAIDTLSATSAATPQEAAAVLQQMEPRVPGMSHVLAEFLQESSSDTEVGAPAAAAYTFQSEGVMELLDKVSSEFKTKLSDLSETERARSSAHQLQVQSLADSIKYSKASLSDNEKSLGEAEATKGEATTTKTATEGELEKNKNLLREITVAHEMKSGTFAENQKARKAELTAIVKAIEIISGGKVKGTYGAKIASFSQQAPKPRSPTLLQMFSASRRTAVKQVASEFLQRRSVSRYSPGSTPFAKVSKMMEELVEKLKEEAASEAGHQGLCQKELKANKEKRDALNLKVEQLDAAIGELTSEIEVQTKKLAELAKEMADLTAAMTNAVDLRTKEKQQNTETIEQAAEGAVAVKDALTVLNNFYTGFIQQRTGQAPNIEEYKGATGSAKGILGMLEVIQSDFLSLKASTAAAEEAAAKEHKRFMDGATLDQQSKTGETEVAKALKDKKESKKHEKSKELKSVKEELDGANAYFQELSSACVEVKVSYEERVAAREKEIENLKQAYTVLDSKQ